MKYIAYGSNMVKEQMAIRCPTAKLIGVGSIPAVTLEFYRHATIEHSQDPKATVPVAVWEIEPQDEANLDFYEGYPDYYTKMFWPVNMSDGSEIEGMIYIMREGYPVPPATNYYKPIEKAYADLGLGSQIKSVLRPALERSFKRAKR